VVQNFKNGLKPLNFGQGNFLMKPGARIFLSTKKGGRAKGVIWLP